MRQLLQESYSSRRPVEIIYMDDKGCLTQRFIIVYKIYPQSVKAWCLLRNEKRTFKIENILSCGFSNKGKAVLGRKLTQFKRGFFISFPLMACELFSYTISTRKGNEHDIKPRK